MDYTLLVILGLALLAATLEALALTWAYDSFQRMKSRRDYWRAAAMQARAQNAETEYLRLALAAMVRDEYERTSRND